MNLNKIIISEQSWLERASFEEEYKNAQEIQLPKTEQETQGKIARVVKSFNVVEIWSTKPTWETPGVLEGLIALDEFKKLFPNIKIN